MQMKCSKKACRGTNNNEESMSNVSAMEARGVRRHVQPRCTVGRGSGRNAKNKQSVCMHHLVQLCSVWN